MSSESNQKFSDELEHWLKGRQPKTLDSLIDVFGERSFAVIIMLFMFLPALPLPTGGITHVLEVVAALLALEMIAGFKKLWLPKSLARKIKMGKILEGKFVTALLKRLRWFESHSRPRWAWLFRLPLVERFIGLIILGLIAAAFFAPPFSGLDTLPSLGVVIICLALIVGDSAFLVGGFLVGAFGVFLSVGLGAVIVKAIQSLL